MMGILYELKSRWCLSCLSAFHSGRKGDVRPRSDGGGVNDDKRNARSVIGRPATQPNTTIGVMVGAVKIAHPSLPICSSRAVNPTTSASGHKSLDNGVHSTLRTKLFIVTLEPEILKGEGANDANDF